MGSGQASSFCSRARGLSPHSHPLRSLLKAEEKRLLLPPQPGASGANLSAAGAALVADLRFWTRPPTSRLRQVAGSEAWPFSGRLKALGGPAAPPALGSRVRTPREPTAAGSRRAQGPLGSPTRRSASRRGRHFRSALGTWRFLRLCGCDICTSPGVGPSHLKISFNFHSVPGTKCNHKYSRYT